MKFLLLLILLLTFNLQAQQPVIFSLHEYSTDGEYYNGFISVSDKYALSEHSDSLAIPDISNYTPASARHLVLEGKYRERLLEGTGISSSDKAFIYDYSADVLVSLNISDLDVIANLNPYSGEDDFPYPPEYYMYGFAVKKELLRGFSDHYSEALVYIGRENPFVRGQLKPLVWEKAAAPKGVVKLASPYDESEIREYTLTERYEASCGELLLTVQNSHFHSVSARQLTIESTNSGEILCQRVFHESEGVTLVELNNNEPDERTPTNQWIGKLFKDLPPVVFGFEYLSFDCPSFIVVESQAEDLYINCDSRH